MTTQNLITSQVHVQTPIIKVIIGEYEFGVYDNKKAGFAKYPNYVQNLQITKINGQVNTYDLGIVYPITEADDPNYFEKVFSSVSKSRKIVFTYGDASAPSFIYKNEEALITKVRSSFNIDGSSISYSISAVSKAALGLSGSYSFPKRYEQPSRVLKELLQNKYYGLQDLFIGMRNMTLVNQAGLIPENDVPVAIEKQDGVSILDYMQYLVSLMNPKIGNKEKGSFYIMSFVDDTTEKFGGPYFKITQVDSQIEHPDAYQLDIGYPGSNYVFNFNVENDENYSIFYDYQNSLHPQSIVSRINADGDYENIFAPTISSKNAQHDTKENDKTWWAKMTQYPIKASLTIKGLLRPAILMNYVRLNIVLFGKKHVNSGLYIITKQLDKVDGNGYQTTLNLLRVGSD